MSLAVRCDVVQTSASRSASAGARTAPWARAAAGRQSASSRHHTVGMAQYTARKSNGPGCDPGPVAASTVAQTLRTFCACKPLGPWATSNSTTSPSARLLKPSAWIAVKWTNTSGPDSCAIKPKPFASLNHFTLPFAILCKPQHLWGTAPDICDPDHRDQGRAQTKTARQVVLAERRQTGDGATYCLNRDQNYPLRTAAVNTPDLNVRGRFLHCREDGAIVSLRGRAGNTARKSRSAAS